MDTDSSVRNVVVQVVGGSTALIEVGGLRFVVDPTFDPPGPGQDGMPRRTTPPAIDVDEVGHLDVGLVSHDQHPDNLDDSGRRLLAGLPLVVTTAEGAGRLGGPARGLAPFEHLDVERPGGSSLRVTALPAQHGPDDHAEAVSGPVIGFLLSADDVPSVYVSGDNASLDVVREIAARVGRVDIAVLFAGAASVGGLFDGAPLTLGSVEAVEAGRILGAGAVVPLHYDGWTHYTQGPASLAGAFEVAGLQRVLHMVAAGTRVELHT